MLSQPFPARCRCPFKGVYGGFLVNFGGGSLGLSGLTINDAEITLPSNLLPSNVSPVTVKGSLSITRVSGQTTINGMLSVGPVAISLAGFTVNTGSITLSNTGLAVSNAQVSLPASLSPGGTPPTLTGNLTIAPDFTVVGSLTTGPFSLAVAGFTVSADGISLTNANGLVVSNARLTLPASFLPAGSSPVTLVGNLSVDPKFNVTASLSTTNVNIAYAGVALHVDSIVLNNSGLRSQTPR